MSVAHKPIGVPDLQLSAGAAFTLPITPGAKKQIRRRDAVRMI